MTKALPLQHLKILLTEDNECIREMLGYFLSNQGATVEFAGDGPECLSKAFNGNFDVVMMDLNLPGMNGECITKALREGNFKSPIIVISAHRADFLEKKCTEVGFQDYISKPFDLEEVTHKILNCLKH